MAKVGKTPYETYKTQSAAAHNDTLYLQIFEKAKKFDVSMFQNPDLAKDLCNTTLVPAKLTQSKSQAVIDAVIWLLESRNDAQLSQE